MFKRLVCTTAVALVGALFAVSTFPALGQTKVTDSLRNPLSDVLVQRVETNDLPMPPASEQWTTVAVTKTDGLFDSDIVAAKSLVVLSKDGFASAVFDGQKALPGTVVLSDGAEITGTVFDAQGAAVAGALVGPVLKPSEDDSDTRAARMKSMLPPLWTRSDPAGVFRFRGLATGNYNFLIHKRGLAPEMALASTGIETSVTLSSSGTTWTGTLVGSRDGLPQPNTYVEAASAVVMPLRLSTLTGPRGEFIFPALPEGHEWQFRTAPSRTGTVRPAKLAQLDRGTSVTDIVLLANQGVSVGGKLFDGGTSAPIAHLSLTLNPWEGGEPITTSTDESGFFRFENVDAFRNLSLRFGESPYMYFSPEYGSWVDQYGVSTQEGQDITTVSIALVPRVMVRGLVLGADKLPASGAAILLRSQAVLEQGFDELSRHMSYMGITDVAGRFETEVFPPGKYEVRASIESFFSDAKIYEVLTTSSEEIILEMKPAVSLRGRTVTADGAPLSGSRVEMSTIAEASETSALPPGRLVGSTRSVENGKFIFDGVFPDKVLLTATHRSTGDSVTSEIAIISSEDTLLELRFPPANSFSAHVTNEKGAPLPDVAVQVLAGRADGADSSATRYLSGRTDSDGLTTFALNASLVARATARHPDFAPFAAEQIALPRENFEIILKSYPSVSVTLNQPPDAPEAAQQYIVFLLRAAQSVSATEEPLPSHFTSIRNQPAVYGTARFENVEPGWYKAATATNSEAIYSETEAFQLKADGESLEVQLALASGASLQGRIIDEDTGEPIQGANVSVQLQSGTPMDFEIISRPSDANGGYKIAVLPPAAVVVTAKHPEYPDKATVVNVPQTGQATVDIKMGHDADTLLTGLVTLDDRPLANATIIVYSNADMAKWVGSAVSGPDGKYAIENVPEGARTMVVEALWGTDLKALRRTQTVMVRGRTAKANVAFRSLVYVTGRVQMDSVDLDTDETHTLHFSSLTFFGDVRRVVVGADGDYEIYLEAGAYTVGLQDGPGVAMEVPEASDEFTANFDFDELAKASGLQLESGVEPGTGL